MAQRGHVQPRIQHASARTPDRSLLERLPLRLEGTADEDGRLRRLLVVRCLEDLADSERQLVVYRYYDGRTDREIAAVLGIRPGTVKPRLNRIRRSIAATMAGWEE